MTALSRTHKRELLKRIVVVTYTVIFGLYSFVTIFIPIDTVVLNYNSITIWWRLIILLIFAAIPFIIGIFLSMLCIFYYSIRKSCKYPLKGNEEAVFQVEYGDLHEIMFPKKPPQKCYTVIIPVHNQLNRLFEDWEGKGRSIHGNWLLEIKSNPKRYHISLQELANDCSSYLQEKYCDEYNKDAHYEYKIGDGVRINGDRIGIKNISYYFLATNMMSKDDIPCYVGSSKEGTYLHAIQGIVDAYRNALYEQEIYMPVIGGGFAQMERTQSELISMIYQIFQFNSLKFKSAIHVVIYRSKEKEAAASIYLK